MIRRFHRPEIVWAEPVAVARAWDELWVAVKSKSSLVIAGSPRNLCK